MSLKNTRENHIEANVGAARDIIKIIGKKRANVTSGILRGLVKTRFCSNIIVKQVRYIFFPSNGMSQSYFLISDVYRRDRVRL